MKPKPCCSICHAEFEVQFRYQAELRPRAGGGSPETLFFCSQACLAKSHAAATSGLVACDSCGSRFAVELAREVLYLAGRRHYACSETCRARIANASSADHRPSAGARPSRRPGSPRVLAVFNHKGGTGKTTTSVNVAAGLAARGERVLLVDTDGQGNVAVSLGVSAERSLYHVLVMGLPIRDAVTEVRPGLDLLPSNETLAAAELYLAGRRQRDRVLAERLTSARESYDFIVVDCSPSLSLMNQNALCFADSVLCPVACDYLSLVGVRQVLRTIRQVNRLLGHPVALWGVLPTMFDSRARICHEALGTLREHFKERCLDPVRTAIKVKEAPAEGKTLREYAPGLGAAADYDKVVEKLLADTVGVTLTPELSRLGGVA